MAYKILVINPGSTSTKVSLHLDEKCLFSTDVFHDSSILKNFNSINDQLNYRMKVLYDFFDDNNIDLNDIDAITGRGGGCYPLESGIYIIDEQLINDTKEAKGNLYHSSMLGIQMANELNKRIHKKAFVVDPPVVDELWDVARITGVKGIYRKAISHALNLKEAARVYCQANNLDYNKTNLIVCHIDGGISITAHHNGKMIDGNDAGGGQGPFTPTRMGSLAITDMINFLNDKSYEEIRSLCSQTGGLSSYFNTSNADTIHLMVENNDPIATLVWNAMIYQIGKYIGAMATVLNGKVDAIILTGGLLRFKDINDKLNEMCNWIAPITVYPGEFEHQAMAKETLKVLKNVIAYKTYKGKVLNNVEKLFKANND